MASKRNMYSMHHQVATVGRIGHTVPFLKLEVAPGDTWSGKVGMLIRFSPLKRALLQDMYVDQYVFYVPWRLVFDQWEDFIAQGPNANPVIQVPYIAGPDVALFNNNTGNMNALYRRAYNLCWNEFFRDEALAPVGADYIPPSTVPGAAGNHFAGPKRHWINELRELAQTGQAAKADVKIPGTNAVWPGVALPGTSVAVMAEDILRAIAQQKLQMKRATYGTRYIDILRSYGVSVRHDMLQLPELVATAHGSMNITDVVSAADTATGALGQLAGHGISGTRINIRRKTFSEHGCLLGLVVVRPPFMSKILRDWMDYPPTYQDFYDPALELLPNETYPTQRIAGSGAVAAYPYGPWGQHYRQALSRVHDSLQDWCLDHFNSTTGFASLDELYSCGSMQIDADDLFTDVSQGHYQVSAVNGLRALRMIKRGNPAIRSGAT